MSFLSRLGLQRIEASSRAKTVSIRTFGLALGHFAEQLAPFSEKAAFDAYKNNPFFYRAVETLVNAYSSIGLEFYPVGGEDGDPVKPIPRVGGTVENLPYVFLRRPNSYASGRNLIASFWRNYFVTGLGTMHFKPRKTVENSVAEVHSIPSSAIRLNVNVKTGEPESYIVGWQDDKQSKFKVSPGGVCELFVATHEMPERPFKALSPAQVAYDSVQAVTESNRHNHRLVKSGMAISGMFTPSAKEEGESTPMKQDDIDNFNKQLQEMGGGAKNSGRYLILDYDAKFTALTHSTREMAYKDVLDMLSRQILMTLGVPPQLLGVSTEANAYANYQQAQRSFYENVIVPGIEEFCADLSAYLQRNGYEFIVKPDLETISVYRDLRVERMKNLADVSFLDDNEKRDFFGYKPLTPEQEKKMHPPPEEKAPPKPAPKPAPKPK